MILTQGGRELLEENGRYTHVISIVCPDDTEVIGNDKHYVAKMWDINETLKNNFREYKAPDLMSVLNILSWMDVQFIKCEPNINLLVHCDAGVSRSPAVALGVLWSASSLFFKPVNELTRPTLIHPYMSARKEWCANQVSDDSVALKRFIEGRYNPGVKPNMAVLKHLRTLIADFPW